MKNGVGAVTLLGVIFLAISTISYGQNAFKGFSDQGRAAQYYLGGQDQVLMPVNVWGFVNKPGQYMVPYDTDLISLLSYAGGPREDAKITKIKLVRAAFHGKSTEKGNGQVIEIDVKKYIESGQAEIIPILKPGDTIVVSGTTFYFVSKFFDFTWRVATLIQVWALVNFYVKR